MANKPILHNIRILDFTWVLAGPYATRLLADYGAEVIKVQPLFSSEADNTFTRGYYNTWNRNKLGITLNLNKPEGLALVKKLVGICDAVIENFTPHVMANWGLDYTHLKQIKPDIIMVSLSALGQQSNYAGYGPTVHALSGMTGLMSLDGKPIGPGFSYADHIAGLYASLYLLGALEHRRQTGKGQYIDLSEVDAMAGILNQTVQPEVIENVYLCKDERWCAITVDTEEAWRGLKRALGNPVWTEDVLFLTPESRLANKKEMERLIGIRTRECTANEVMYVMQKNGVAAGIVQDAADLTRDEQLKERGFFTKGGGVLFTDAQPIKMENQKVAYKHSPDFGQDNSYVYGNLLGLSDKEITKLKKKGVI